MERGSGRPILLVHGWGAGGEVTWRRQLDSLSNQFHVLAPDLPGFGSTTSRPPSDAAAFATALREFVDARRLRETILVGWSMGGLVALDYAVRFGCHGLAGLTVVDVALRARPAPDWPVEADFGRRVEDWTARWEAERAAVVREATELAFVDRVAHREEIDELVRDALRADAPSALAAFRNILDCDFRDSIGVIDVPILLLFGGSSTSTSRRDAEVTKMLAHHARLAVFDGCGHALMIEDPQRFDAELRRFACSPEGAVR